MAIPTLIAWEKATSHIGKRSPEMGIIDDKIQAYWDAHQDGNRGEMNKAAYAIRKACRHWKKNHHGSKRMGKVDRLEREAEAELSQYQPGWDEFAGKKGAGKSVHRIGLAGAYQYERRWYKNVIGKQTNPVAAGYVRDQAWIGAVQDARANGDPDPDADEVFEDLDEGAWNGYAYDAFGEGNKVLYFDKQERLEYMLLVRNGRLVWARNGTYFETPHGEFFIYAMDKYGNLFARTHKVTGIAQGFFNHSSFNAGRKVICAGNIVATNGLLDFISNESGHYKPSRGALFSCVKVLRDANVTMVFGNARTRVRARWALGEGDWPAIHDHDTPGFDQVYAATAGNPPAAVPDPPTYTRWGGGWVHGVAPGGQV